jgi:hypothetical protein
METLFEGEASGLCGGYDGKEQRTIKVVLTYDGTNFTTTESTFSDGTLLYKEVFVDRERAKAMRWAAHCLLFATKYMEKYAA